MRICLMPLKFERKNPTKSMRHLKECLSKILQHQPDLICFPECCLTGYLWEHEDIIKYAEPIPGPTTDTMSRIAKKHGVFIAFGMLEKAGSAIYNSAVLINRSGEIILKHRKIQEPPPFQRGKTVKSVETELGRLSMIICGDLFNEEVIRKVDRTTDLLILLTGGFYAGKFADYNKGYSEDREAYLDAVKKIGVSTAIVSTLEPTLESEKVYFGIGMVVDDKGNLLKESSHKADEFLVFDI